MTRTYLAFHALMTLALALSANALAREGHATGGGNGELTTIENNPWFLGSADEEVTYCIEKSGDFSVTLADARKSIKWAIDDWTQTLSQLPIKPTPPLKDGKSKGLRRALREVGAGADGRCDFATDLIFYLGVSNPRIIEATRGRIADGSLVGVAQTLSYDESTGRAKGFIWISSDRGPNVPRTPGLKLDGDLWSGESRRRFRNVLLHEIGHVFGFPHIPSTVMDAQVPANALLNDPKFEYPVSYTSREFWVRSFRLPYGPTILCSSSDPRGWSTQGALPPIWTILNKSVPVEARYHAWKNWRVCIKTVTPVKPVRVYYVDEFLYSASFGRPELELTLFTPADAKDDYGKPLPPVSFAYKFEEQAPKHRDRQILQGTFAKIEGRYLTQDQPEFSILTMPHVFIDLQIQADVTGILSGPDKKESMRLQFPADEYGHFRVTNTLSAEAYDVFTMTSFEITSDEIRTPWVKPE